MDITRAKSLFKALTGKIFAVVALGIVASLAKASIDNIRFERVSPEAGLSQQTIQSIYQDSRGFMWFGTQEGLNKYDGIKFTIYSPKYDDLMSISSSWINAIGEDSNGNIWVGTANGINVLDITTDTFTRYQEGNEQGAITNNDVTVIHRANNGTMWIAHKKGLNQYEAQTKTFKHHNFISNSGKEIEIKAIAEDITGALWLGSTNGLMRFDPELEQVTMVTPELKVDNGKKTVVNIVSLFLDREQVLWIATANYGIYSLDLKTAKTKSLIDAIIKIDDFGEQRTKVIASDSKDTIWVGTVNGLFYKKVEDDSFVSLNDKAAGQNSLASATIESLLLDESGVFWVGTFNGLHKWNTHTTQFDHYYADDIAGRALSSNSISTVVGNKENLVFLSSPSGVDILDTETQTIRSLPLETDTQAGLKDLWVMSIGYVNEEEIWFGYRTSGVSRYNPKTNTYTHYSADKEDPNSLPGNGISAIIPSASGELWFGVFRGGLARYNPSTDDFTVFQHDPSDISSISSDLILTVYESSDGNLWLGTWDAGLNVFVPKTGTAFRMLRRPNIPTSIGSNKVTSILEDKQGNIWVGTHSGGLNLLKGDYRDSGVIEFEKIDSEDGMPSNVVYGITEDDFGFLWVSTNKGLVRVNKETKEVVVYTSSQGLQGNEFHSGAYYEDELGYMYFGGVGGLTRFHPKDVQANPKPPKIEFTSFQRLNKFYNFERSKNENNKIDVYYTDYLVGFEFAALDFVNPKNNNYLYMLEGFDKDWVEVRDAPRATYTNLPSGEYTLRVIASNNDGTWNKEGASVGITVHPAPWFSWWAYAIYALLFAIFVWRVYQLNQRKDAARLLYESELQREVDIRTAELSEANIQLRKASITDQMTGLHNRRYLSEVISERLEDINRRFAQAIIDNEMDATQGPRLMALMFDLDGFKPINDNYGHEAGDQVIIQVANVLKRECRENDIVVRWGGDEYMVVAEVKNLEEATALSERIRQAISGTAFDVGLPNKFNLSSSLGFALYPFCHHAPHSITWDQVHLLADHALYMSKDAGRNTWSGIVQVEKELPFSVLNTLVPNLDKALSRNEVMLVQRDKQDMVANSN